MADRPQPPPPGTHSCQPPSSVPIPVSPDPLPPGVAEQLGKDEPDEED